MEISSLDYDSDFRIKSESAPGSILLRKAVVASAPPDADSRIVSSSAIFPSSDLFSNLRSAFEASFDFAEFNCVESYAISFSRSTLYSENSAFYCVNYSCKCVNRSVTEFNAVSLWWWWRCESFAAADVHYSWNYSCSSCFSLVRSAILRDWI